jgi:hypothetical protein
LLQLIVSDIVDFRLSAQLLELASDDACFLVGLGEDANRSPAGNQLRSHSIAVVLIEAEILVVKRTKHSAGYHCAHAYWRRQHSEDEPNAGALADAAASELVSLDVAIGLEDKDADGRVTEPG